MTVIFFCTSRDLHNNLVMFSLPRVISKIKAIIYLHAESSSIEEVSDSRRGKDSVHDSHGYLLSL